MTKRRRPRIVIFTILTTITLVTWAIFDVWRTFQKPVPLEIEESLLREVTPPLDRQKLEILEGRIFFSDSEVRALPPVAPPTPNENAATGEATEGENQ